MCNKIPFKHIIASANIWISYTGFCKPKIIAGTYNVSSKFRYVKTANRLERRTIIGTIHSLVHGFVVKRYQIPYALFLAILWKRQHKERAAITSMRIEYDYYRHR